MKKFLLYSFMLGAYQTTFGQCSELFFSEYAEGTGNNKAMEIFNPTSNAISLSNYRLVRYSNGSTIPTDSLQLTGTILPHDAWVVVNGQTTTQPNSPACDPALQAMADQLDGTYPAPTYMNGNDAMVLVKISPRTLVDIFGKIGEDPGLSWTDVFPYTDAQGTYWTKDHTLRRKSTIEQGVTVNPTAFNVTVQWDSLPKNTWTGLGTHTCNCALGIEELAKNVQLKMFPNPVTNGSFIINASEIIEQVEIVNTLGEIISTIKVSDHEKELNVSTAGLAAGLYFVNVKFSNGFLTNKISVQ